MVYWSEEVRLRCQIYQIDPAIQLHNTIDDDFLLMQHFVECLLCVQYVLQVLGWSLQTWPNQAVLLRLGFMGERQSLSAATHWVTCDCQQQHLQVMVGVPSELWDLDPCLVEQRCPMGQSGGQGTWKKQGCFLEHRVQKRSKAWHNGCRIRSGVIHFFNPCST